MDLIRYCKRCGTEVKLLFPERKDQRYKVKKLRKKRKAEPEDYKYSQHNFIKNEKITGEWIAIQGIKSFHGKCKKCGKRIFEILPRKDENEYVPVPRSIIKTKKVVEVVLDNFVLFELGVHWPYPDFNHIETKIKDIRGMNQLNLF